MALVGKRLPRRSLAVSLSLCLVLPYIGPSVAAACEGVSIETLPRLVNAKGEELQRAFNVRSGTSELAITPTDIIICTSDEVENARVIRGMENRIEATRVVLRGCKRGAVRCNSPGAANAEEVVTGAVEFVLLPSPGRITDVLWLMGARGGNGRVVFVTVECGRETFRILQGALGTLTPVDRRTRTLTAVFEQEEEKQKLTEYVNEKREVAKTFFEAEGEGEEILALKEIGFSSTEELQFEEEVEIVT